MPYIDVHGVHTYYETEGEGEPLLLLHGGAAPIDFWGPQRPAFAAAYRLYLPERRAHGRTPDIDGPITYEVMADDTVAFMEAMEIKNAHIVGWSDGGNIGMLMAVRRPDLVRTLVSIGGNYHFEGMPEEMRAVAANLTPETFMPALVDLYGQLSPDGAGHFGVVLKKVTAMWVSGPTLTPADLAGIAAPTLVMVGDADMPTLEHTIALYRAIPSAQLCVVPGASHTVAMNKPELVNRIILDFLASPARSGEEHE